jgi:hypothetical protein
LADGGERKGNRHQCRFVPELRCIPGCWGFVAEGVSISECRYSALESQPLAHDADAEDQAAAKASAAARLHDALRKRRGFFGFARRTPHLARFFLIGWYTGSGAASSRAEVVNGES